MPDDAIILILIKSNCSNLTFLFRPKKDDWPIWVRKSRVVIHDPCDAPSIIEHGVKKL